MLPAVFSFLPAFYAGAHSASAFSAFGVGVFIFFCGYGAFVLCTYVYTHYILHSYVHNVKEPLIFGFLKKNQIKGILIQICVPSIVGWGIAFFIF
jgi:hypothetical protein